MTDSILSTADDDGSDTDGRYFACLPVVSKRWGVTFVDLANKKVYRFPHYLEELAEDDATKIIRGMASGFVPPSGKMPQYPTVPVFGRTTLQEKEDA